jgi:CRISPR/Cas system-associated protein Cas5 (RAMP superfamily)
MGAVSQISRAFPSAVPSLMSRSTISFAISRVARTLAQVAPTLPAPTTVIFMIARVLIYNFGFYFPKTLQKYKTFQGAKANFSGDYSGKKLIFNNKPL